MQDRVDSINTVVKVIRIECSTFLMITTKQISEIKGVSKIPIAFDKKEKKVMLSLSLSKSLLGNKNKLAVKEAITIAVGWIKVY